MQTFLPLPSFTASAKVLDRARLGKQRIECKQILNSLYSSEHNSKRGWVNHPATKMWKKYEIALCFYAIEICKEWRARGYKDVQLEFFKNALAFFNWNILDIKRGRELNLPFWFGDNKFHASHRSNLLRKNIEWYGQFGWQEKPDLPYVWPV